MTLGFHIMGALVAFLILFFSIFVGACVLQAVLSVFGVRLA